jgi:hypothetical protein
VISRESNALAGATDGVLEQSLPRKYVSDPAYVLGETEPELDLYDVLNNKKAASSPQAGPGAMRRQRLY